MTKKQVSITSDEAMDENESIIMWGFHPFSPLRLPSTNSSPSSLSDNTNTDDSLISTELYYDFDWDMTNDTLLIPSSHQQVQKLINSAVDYSGSNMRNNDVDMTLLPSHSTAPLFSTVDYDAENILDADLLEACFEATVVGDNPTQPNAPPEDLDLFPESVAPHHNHPTSSSNDVASGHSTLNRQQFDQQEYHSMLYPQQSDIPQLDCQLKKDAPCFDTNTNQLHNDNSPIVVVVGSGSNADQKITCAHPTRLSIPTDEQFLDPGHNFLRHTCIEVFVSSNEHNSGGIGRGSKPNLVGLRCAYCKHIPKRERANQSVSYPSKTANICESVRNFQRTHLEACEYIPDQIKKKYRELVSQTYRKVPLKYVKVYVAEAANLIGIVQTPEGLIFGAPPNTSGKPSKKLEAIMSIAENPTAFNHLHDVIFPKVDDRLKKLKFSHIASDNTLQVIANCRKAEAAFVHPSDFPTLSDFCFVLYHQFVPCRPPKTALSRRKTKPEKWDTLSGLCCKYCSKAHPGEGYHKGMYFPLDLEAMHDSSSSFAHNVTVHAMTCQHVPPEVKDAMEELQRLAAEHGVTTKRGAKQRFMKKLWERLANYYPATSK